MAKVALVEAPCVTCWIVAIEGWPSADIWDHLVHAAPNPHRDNGCAITLCRKPDLAVASPAQTTGSADDRAALTLVRR